MTFKINDRRNPLEGDLRPGAEGRQLTAEEQHARTLFSFYDADKASGGELEEIRGGLETVGKLVGEEAMIRWDIDVVPLGRLDKHLRFTKHRGFWRAFVEAPPPTRYEDRGVNRLLVQWEPDEVAIDTPEIAGQWMTRNSLTTKVPVQIVHESRVLGAVEATDRIADYKGPAGDDWPVVDQRAQFMGHDIVGQRFGYFVREGFTRRMTLTYTVVAVSYAQAYEGFDDDPDELDVFPDPDDAAAAALYAHGRVDGDNGGR